MSQVFERVLTCEPSVDGKKLPHKPIFDSEELINSSVFIGTRLTSNGIEFKQALRFVKVAVATDDTAGVAATNGTGKIEFDVHGAIDYDFEQPRLQLKFSNNLDAVFPPHRSSSYCRGSGIFRQEKCKIYGRPTSSCQPNCNGEALDEGRPFIYNQIILLRGTRLDCRWSPT